jgi:hypothetical protein
MARTSFPKTLHVKIENDRDTSYFVADADAASLVDMGDKTKLGVYQLVEIVEGEGVVRFTPKKKK